MFTSDHANDKGKNNGKDRKKLEATSLQKLQDGATEGESTPTNVIDV
jgi:hypothetical protein